MQLLIECGRKPRRGGIDNIARVLRNAQNNGALAPLNSPQANCGRSGKGAARAVRARLARDGKLMRDKGKGA